MGLSDKEWDQRILCSDGNCIGIIGSDGRCKECGRAYDGELPATEEDLAAVGDEEPAVLEPEAADEAEGDEEQFVDTDASGDDWEDRTLCVDGNCIGVVGSDGRCKVCGKVHPGKQS